MTQLEQNNMQQGWDGKGSEQALLRRITCAEASPAGFHTGCGAVHRSIVNLSVAAPLKEQTRPSNQKLSKGSKLVVGAHGSSPPCWNADATAAVMSGMHWFCHGEKT